MKTRKYKKNQQKYIIKIVGHHLLDFHVKFGQDGFDPWPNVRGSFDHGH